MKHLIAKENQLSSESSNSECTPTDGDISRLKNVINFYRKPCKIKHDIKNFKTNNIYHNGDNKYFDCWSQVFEMSRLPDNMRKEMLEEMSDWELYINCKEQEECKRDTIAKRDYSVRNKNAGNILIKSFSSTYCRNGRNHTFKENDKNEYCYPELKNLCDNSFKKKDAELERYMGNECFKKGNYEKALEHYMESINIFPTVEAYNNRAITYIKLKNFPAAIKDAECVLRKEATNFKALYRRILCKKEMHMYQEALGEINENMKSKKCFQDLFKELEDKIKKLNGKKYTVRENFGRQKTFVIYASQLFAYANSENKYLLEIDKTGCAMSCICGYCSEEDRRSRFQSNSLRLKERKKWGLLVPNLLNVMQISFPVTRKENNFSEPLLNSNVTVSMKLANDSMSEMRKSLENNIHSVQKLSGPKKNINFFTDISAI